MVQSKIRIHSNNDSAEQAGIFEKVYTYSKTPMRYYMNHMRVTAAPPGEIWKLSTLSPKI